MSTETPTVPAPRRRARRAPPVSIARVRPVSAAVAIHRELRQEIASLRMPPGAPVNENEIARRYGVSRTPVREAVRQLAAEGLIDVFPQSGTFVSRIPLKALPEAIIIRRSLEETAARLAAERADAAHFANLRAIMDRLRETAARGERGLFHEADESFHAAVAAAAGYPGIWTLVQQVKLQVDRYRRLTLPQEGRLTRVIAEHDAVRAAIEAREPDRAAALMGFHVGGLLTDLGDVRTLNPDHFTE